VVYFDATIHHHTNAGRARGHRRGWMTNPQLHPDTASMNRNSVINQRRHSVGLTKTIDDIDPVRGMGSRVRQTGVTASLGLTGMMV